MIWDTLRAETLKFAANRGAVLWGVAAVPVLVLLFGGFGEAFVWATVPTARMVARAPLITDATAALSAAGNPIFHVFYASAAAIVFAGEYRWETWRFLVPRSRRTALMGGKLGAFASFAALGLVLTVAAGVAVGMFSALLNRAAPGDHADLAAAWAGFALAFTASLLQLGVLGGMAALVAVVTRSLMGAVLAVFMASLGQAIFLALFQEMTAQPAFIALLPNLAGDTARRFAHGVAGDPDAAGAAGGLAFACLAGWAAVTLGAAMALFARQDLSQE